MQKEANDLQHAQIFSSIKIIRMVSRSLAFLLYYFNAWGFYTEFAPSFYCKYLSLLAFLVQLLFSLFAIIFAIYEIVFEDILSVESYLANEAMKTYFAMLTHSMIIIEAFSSRASQHKFWTLINRAQQKGFNQSIKLRAFTFFFIQSALLTALGGWMMVYNNHPDMLKRKVHMIIVAINNQMYLHRIHYYTLHVEIVRIYLEYLVRIGENVSPEALAYIKLNEKYEMAGELIECVNETFGWSNAASILFSFNRLLAIANWTISLLGHSSPRTIFSKSSEQQLN